MARIELLAQPQGPERDRAAASMSRRSQEGDPWMAVALAETLMGLPEAKDATEIFRHAVRASFLFERCEIATPERDLAVELRAGTLGLLSPQIAADILGGERARVDRIAETRSALLCQDR